MAEKPKAQLAYTLICDDVRIEMGNKMSLMGIFQNILLPRFPATIVKFAVLNRWVGQGTFTYEIRIVGPSGIESVRSHPATFTIGRGGHADNVTFFTNVQFQEPGIYTVRILLSDRVVGELQLNLRVVEQKSTSGTVN